MTMNLVADILEAATLAPGAGEVARYPLRRSSAGTVVVRVAESPTIVDDPRRLNGACLRDLLHRSAVVLESRSQPVDPPASGALRAGIATIDETGRLTIREPLNHYGGYVWTFAKGGRHGSETPRETAARELKEETGLEARILTFIGDFKGDTSVTRMYFGRETGGTPTPNRETATIEAVDPVTAYERFNKQRDRDILRALIELAARTVDWEWQIDGAPYRCTLLDGVITATPL
jgi:8-oxo-dGTP pyrophosphatase MutT (NUDIX family)